MTSTVFFSWQSDTPPRIGRNFLDRALERAIGLLATDLNLEEAVRELTVDRDTKGVPGSPRIVDTIFKKIDEAEVFLADVTFVGRRLNQELTPNPNVLIEYGWALKSLTHDRVLTIMNTAYGAPTDEALPFDMRHLRHPIQYQLAEDASPDEVRRIRDELARTLAGALTEILKLKRPAPSRSLFVRREPGSSVGTFRKENEPLAYSHDSSLTGADYPVRLQPGPLSWIRLMPKFDPGKQWTFSELKAAATTSSFYLSPYGFNDAGSIGWLRAPDGFGTRVMLRDKSDQTLWVSFVFTTGEIWGIDALTLGATKGYITLDHLGIARTLETYRNLLKRLGIDGPYIWNIGLEDANGRTLSANGRFPFLNRGSALTDVVQVDGELLGDQDVKEAVSSFVAYVYDQCGLKPPNG